MGGEDTTTGGSKKRRSAGGWVNPKELKRGPGGRPLCRECGTEVPKGRRSFCSKECVDRWRVRTDPGYARLLVFRRDKGICAQCGTDTMEGLKRPRARGTGHLWQADHIVPVVEGGGECSIENLRTLCTACHQRETNELRARLSEARKVEKAEEKLAVWRGEKEPSARTVHGPLFIHRQGRERSESPASATASERSWGPQAQNPAAKSA